MKLPTLPLIWPIRFIDFPVDNSLIIVEKDFRRAMLYVTYNKFPYIVLPTIVKARNCTYLCWGRLWCSLALCAKRAGLADYDENICFIACMPGWFLRGFVRQWRNKLSR